MTLPAKTLVAENLSHSYADSESAALSDLNITIDKGEIFGLLGPNGAGKTTAISIFSTLLSPTSGMVKICDIDIRKNPFEVKRLISVVPQEIALYQKLSIKENLEFFANLHGIKNRKRTLRVNECLDFVDLGSQKNKLINHCSGGIKRRANLAVGLLNNPKLLFLDEPTVGIDAQSRHLILEKLKILSQSEMTMLYTTHYLEEAEHLCTSAAIIDNGQVIASGSPEKLITQHQDCNSLQDLFLNTTGRSIRD
jgi:ABC-2 type transport system ATP-binding protein